MTETSTQAPAVEPAPAEAEQRAAQPARQRRVKLAVKDVLAAINDGADDSATVAELNRALYNFGAQDPSFELPRSWQRVQRRIGVDPDKLDGIATAEQVTRFAERAGLTIAK